MKASAQQLEVVPLQGDVVGLKPDPILVGDRQPANADIAEQVTLKPFNLQIAKAANGEPIGARLDQAHGRRRHGAEPYGGEEDADQGQQGHSGDGQPALQARAGLRHHLILGLKLETQKLCPILR